MADELTVNASLVYEDSEGTMAYLEKLDLLPDVAVKRVVRAKMNVGTSEEAIPLGDVSSPGWAMFVNRDATNFITILTGTGGVAFAKMLPGETLLLRFGSGVSAPYAVADTAACQMDYLVAST